MAVSTGPADGEWAGGRVMELIQRTVGLSQANYLYISFHIAHPPYTLIITAGIPHNFSQ